MPSDLPRFTIRTHQANLDKIAYIAEEEHRSTTKEIEHLIVKRITEYEAKFGEIKVDSSKKEK